MAAAASVSGACSRDRPGQRPRHLPRAPPPSPPRARRDAIDPRAEAQRRRRPRRGEHHPRPDGTTSPLLDRIIIIGDRIDEDVATRLPELLALSHDPTRTSASSSTPPRGRSNAASSWT